MSAKKYIDDRVKEARVRWDRAAEQLEEALYPHIRPWQAEKLWLMNDTSQLTKKQIKSVQKRYYARQEYYFWVGQQVDEYIRTEQKP